jgi:hypothetical protein
MKALFIQGRRRQNWRLDFWTRSWTSVGLGQFWALPLGQDRENPGASILHGRTVENQKVWSFFFFSFFLPFDIQEGVGGGIHVLGVGSLVFDFVISKSWRILPKEKPKLLYFTLEKLTNGQFMFPYSQTLLHKCISAPP